MKNNKINLNDDFKIRLVVFLSVVIRLIYVSVAKVVETRQYDLGSVAPEKGILSGHLGYIYYLFLNKKLPDFDPREVYQFFHPPLHHGIEALWLNVVSRFTDSIALQTEWLQIPTLIYSIIIIFVIYGICKELHLNKTGTLITLTIFGFNPTLIFMAGSLNNDGLSLMFQFLVIYTTIRWYHNRTNLNIIFIALSISLGMITKLSTGLMAVPVAFVFLCVFWYAWNKKGFPKQQFLQFVLFGIVCIPIGLSWSIRCYLLFDMPFNHVLHLPEDSWQYVGNYTIKERFFFPSIATLLSNLKAGGIGMGENIWIMTFRTAALGECDLSDFPMWGKLIEMMSIITCFLPALWSFVSMVRLSFTRDFKHHLPFSKMDKWFLLVTYVVFMVFYVNFCYNYPHQCTMNFRYIAPTLLTPCIFMAEGEKDYGKILSKGLSLILLLYVIFSILNTLIWCIY